MSQKQLPGVIESLSAGFGVVNRRLWLMAVPLLLDLALWLSPPVTAAPLAERAVGAAERAFDQEAERRALDSGQRQQLRDQLAQFQRQVGGIDILGLLTWYVPALVGSVPARSQLWTMAPAQISSGLVLAGVLLGLFLLSIGLAGAFMGPLARAARQGKDTLAGATRGLLACTACFGGYVLLVAAAFALAAVPVVVLAMLSAAVAPPLAGLVGIAAVSMALWALFYLSMADKAIFVSGAGPARAIALSVSVVRRHFWPALGLFLLVNVILLGLPLAWRLITGYPAGALVAMVGNAYIGTGVLAGTVVFYRDRALTLQGVSATERSG